MLRRYGGSGGIAPPFLTSTIDGGEWLALNTGRFGNGKKPIPTG
jgi:hypothetical protein